MGPAECASSDADLIIVYRGMHANGNLDISRYGASWPVCGSIDWLVTRAIGSIVFIMPCCVLLHTPDSSLGH